ncbi:MAG: hypothetical protein M3R69_11390 [Acidobacteriota bacterium]|nr:hypothetical protein [Acidobacteriota bacterium]
MNQINKNEVDLLLRTLARHAAESRLQEQSAPSVGNRSFSDHLDADELNSFAEGVLPDSARARYMEHLADCESCRGIVVGLTQAAGAVSPHRVLDQQTGVSFWRKFGALFSPQVLRYAVPAIALAAVIGISLLALRQKQSTEFVAQNQPGRSAAPSDARQTEIPLAPPPGNAAPSITQKSNQPASTPDVSKEKSKPLEDKSLVAQGPTSAGGTGSSTLAKEAPPPSKAAAESQPLFAPEPKAAAPPPPRPALSEADALKTKNEQTAERETRDRQQEEYKNQPVDESGPSRSRAEKPNSAPLNSRRIDGLAVGRAGPSKDKKDSASSGETETRTVSGRTFRRQGNAWIDTAYGSSRAIINVARGSEQFRALTADEPGIRSIADQLAGTVIVVWKGRAYRIQ